jgi:hypothetical protein
MNPWIPLGGALALGILVKGHLTSAPKPAPITRKRGPQLSAAAWALLWSMAADLGTTPQVLAKVMYTESGLDPARVNPNGGAVGVNQFVPPTLATVTNLSPAQYGALPAEGQFPIVEKFWARMPRAAMKTERDLYWVNFTPATYKPGMPDSYDILAKFSNGAPVPASLRAQIVNGNPKIANGKPTILAGDLQAFLDKSTATGEFQDVLAQIAAHAPGQAIAMGGPS